jgi:hypothetical protein
MPNLVTDKLYDNEPIPLFLLSSAVSLSIKMVSTSLILLLQNKQIRI